MDDDFSLGRSKSQITDYFSCIDIILKTLSFFHFYTSNKQCKYTAWSMTFLPGAPQRAEQILRFLDEASQENKRLTPNAYCFTGMYKNID